MGTFTGTVPTILAGYVPTGDDWANILAELTALQASWTDYSGIITLTNLSPGNGTLTARYRQIGKTVDFLFLFELGSTSTVGSTPTFTLPASPGYTTSARNPTFSGVLFRAAGNAAIPYMTVSTNVVSLFYFSAITTVGSISSTSPWTWTTGDRITVGGTYETA